MPLSAGVDVEYRAASLKDEADRLLAQHGLLAMLNAYGRPHVSGSYSMDLMTWRDLDIYLELERDDVASFLRLAGELGAALRPRRLSFTDHLHFPSTEVISGMYLGIQTDAPGRGGWKIDVWGVSRDVCAERLAHCDAIMSRMTPAVRAAILTIKTEVCGHPSYRKEITSQDVYDAAFAGAATTAEFWAHIGQRKRATGMSE